MTFDPNNTAARFIGFAVRHAPIEKRRALFVAALKHIAAALTVMDGKESAAMELYRIGDETIVSKEDA